MPTHDGIDAGREIDWSRTSSDYAAHRPGPPESFYRKLAAMDVGLPGQRILDLGTGTGHLARSFAAQGCAVAGIDIAEGQIEAARALAREQGVNVDFRVAPAEATTHEDASFDLATANQCMLYFDLERTIAELRRVLVPSGGRLVMSHFTTLPRLDPIVRASEELVLRHNPDWSGADWPGYLPTRPDWSREHFDMPCSYYYDEGVPFTRESWRGRMRALRGIGASLSAEQVAAFDAEHAELIDRIAPAEFDILHRLHVHIFQLR